MVVGSISSLPPLAAEIKGFVSRKEVALGMSNLPVFSTLQEADGESRTAIQQTLRELKQFNRYVIASLGILADIFSWLSPRITTALVWRRARCGVSGA